MRLLIVYASTQGQTEKIANRIASVAAQHAADVSVIHARRAGRQDLSAFDAVIVAGSVYWGRHQLAMMRFVRRHREALARVHSVLVSVSNAAASAAGMPHAEEYARKLQERTRWTPDEVVCFAGGMAYTKLGFLVRWMVVRSDRKAGRYRDPSRDYDFTDWDAVDRFTTLLVTKPLPERR